MSNLIDQLNNDIRYVIKRSGTKVVFKQEKIENAILKAMISIDSIDKDMAEKEICTMIKLVNFFEVNLAKN